MYRYTLTFAAAALIAAAVTPLVRRVALAVGAVDEPGGRHLHYRRIPRLGGLAVLTGIGGALAVVSWTGVDLATLLAAYGWHSGWLLAGAWLLLGVSWYATGPSGQPAYGIPGAVVCIAVLVLLFQASSRAWADGYSVTKDTEK